MSTPGITELVRDHDQIVRDIERFEADAKILVGRMGSTGDTRQAGFSIECRASIARDELAGITKIIEELESGDTRDRRVIADILSKEEAV